MKTNLQKFFLFSIIALMIIMPLVSAYSWEELNTDLQSTVSGIKPVLTYIIGKENTDSNQTIAAILMFFLVILVTYGILGSINMFSQTWVNGGIAFLVALIGIRFLDPKLISTLATPSSALVAGIVIGIPFLIVLLVTTKNEHVKEHGKIIWTAYIILNVILLLYNWSKSDSSVKTTILVGTVLGIIGLLIYKKLGKIEELAKEVKSIEGSQKAQQQIAEAKIKQLEEALARAENKEEREEIKKRLKIAEQNLEDITEYITR
jgi:hypothetical protein